MAAAQLLYDVGDKCLCVAEQHQRIGHVIERVIDAGKTRVHAAFYHHDGVGLLYVEHRHSINGAGLVGLGGGIGDVVRPNHECNIDLRKVAVNVVHFHQVIVRNIRFGQQHVHVTWHAARHRVDGETDIDAAFGQRVIEFTDL